MILNIIILLITFSVGLILGIVDHSKISMLISLMVGAFTYLGSLYFLTGPVAIFPSYLTTQILMVIFGGLCSLFGWYIGSNLDLIKKIKL